MSFREPLFIPRHNHSTVLNQASLCLAFIVVILCVRAFNLHVCLYTTYVTTYQEEEVRAPGICVNADHCEPPCGI